MPEQEITREILAKIRALYEKDPDTAAHAIREYLEMRLSDRDPAARIAVLKAVRDAIGIPESRPQAALSDAIGVPEARPQAALPDEVMARFVRLLLGERAHQADLSSEQVMEKLAGSLNTVFDSLNEMIMVMNQTLGRAGFGEETIRAVIGGGLETEESPTTLTGYLGQIKQAFLVAHRAFQKSAHAKVQEILAELSPNKIESDAGSTLKFGPLRKAELFDLYTDAYEKVFKWFSSPRFSEDLLREFEKNVQKSYSKEEVRS
ncbi:MAG TPA: hypothetical protein ENN34_02410 [Deltaproteobacteria bacterium]|nr:hypothetical protein [Deltaproteobacteria bacterium]